MPTSTRGRARAATDDVENTVPNKRQKTEPREEGAEFEGLEGERDDVLWFEDGSVVLAAETKLFKVHAGVLGHHSTVFKELLSAPALAALEERLDGCPVLRTSDRRAPLGQLLRIIYDGVQSDWFNPETCISFPALRLVAIVAAKYNVPEVLDEMKSRLRAFYPADSLQTWRRVAFDDEFDEEDGHDGSLIIQTRDSVAVVELCRLLDMHDTLSVALYKCCSDVSAKDLIRGVTYGKEVVRLTEEDVLRCLQARHSLITETAKMCKAFTAKPQADCTSPESCSTKLEALLLEAIDTDVASSPKPLDVWILFTTAQYHDAEKKPCAVCADALVKSLENAAEDVWQRLSQILDAAL